VKVPVIAAGGIGDSRGLVAAFALGAAGVQIGTGYLLCAESNISPMHRTALAAAADDATVMTNVFTGRPARSIVNRLVREVGPLSDLAPPFPLAAAAVAPLRAKAEVQGSLDFSPLLCGQAAALARRERAGDFTRRIAAEASAWLARQGAA
jgi:nitronate monooxygenase